jgi:L-rhamnose mutarotase
MTTGATPDPISRWVFVAEIRPGTEAEYLRRHDALWPDLAADMRARGVRNFTIFRRDQTIVGYGEVDPRDRDESRIDDAVGARWQAFMSDVIVTDLETAAPFEPIWRFP